jgi:galacturan 1,4-alpha-galacturonidase
MQLVSFVIYRASFPLRPNVEYWSPASIFLEYQNATTAWKLSGSNITLQSPARTGGIDGSGQTWYAELVKVTVAYIC